MTFVPEVILQDDEDLVSKLNSNFDALVDSLAHEQLTNKGDNTHSTIDLFIGSKAGVNGLASLDNNYKVVQNPASSSNIPLANKIPISNEDGLLDDWVSEASISVAGIIQLDNHLGGTYDSPTVVDLSDNIVELRHLEHAVRGDLITYGENGEPVRLSAGASGRILVTNGISAEPSWEINDHSSLTNKGSNTHAQIDSFISSKGASGGVASLDSGSKVIQNPASASSTPEAGKIPIANENGTLDDWITPGVAPSIEDNSITLDKIAHGARGEILYFSVDGAPARLAAGASGYVLKSFGSSADPAWRAFDHFDIANKGTNTHAQLDQFVARAGAASGLATLNSSSLVIQNPASASATPGPGSIPIADQYGLLDSWISPAGTLIEDNGITLSKLDHGTHGDILYYGTDGAPFRLPAGISGQVLKTGGPANNPSWYTINHADISNKGANTHTQIDSFIASKGAPGGLASLDSNSKTVADPANATATPTPSKIPIADAFGKLDGWVTPGVVADDSISLDKLSHGTQGQIIFYGATGTPSALPVGTSGYYLRTHGDAENPAWEAIDHDDLVDKGTNTHSQIDSFISSKASASGLASLNSNSLVVQNPANATATPTASKIPISDGSGKLDGWITYGTSSGTACQGNDSRLSDARTPTSHVHASTDLNDFAEAVSDQVGTMVVNNTETGIAATYDDSSNTLNFAVSYGTEPGTVSSSTSGAAGSNNSASRSDHSHDLGSHSHSDSSSGGTIAHGSLTDKGTNTHSQIDSFISSKAAVSGLASLDGNSLVAQNPANATATPTASKIPIADSGGKLDGWITYGTSSGTSCQGNDSRLSDARTPSAHNQNASTIQAGTFPSGTFTFETVALTKSSSCSVSTLTDGETITPNFADANLFSITLGGNRTLANPTNMTVGQTGVIFIVQDGSGSRTLAYGNYYDFPGGIAPVLSTAASSVDLLSFIVRSSTSICCQLVKAFS